MKYVYFLFWVHFLASLRPSASKRPHRLQPLKCYTCNIDGAPSCDNPFNRKRAANESMLRPCDVHRPDNATEMCAKIIGNVLYDANNRTEPGAPFFAKGCFPIGDAWIWRTEPYNETVMFGNVTIWGSVYICRNTRCNGDYIVTPSVVTLMGAFILPQVLRTFLGSS